MSGLRHISISGLQTKDMPTDKIVKLPQDQTDARNIMLKSVKETAFGSKEKLPDIKPSKRRKDSSNATSISSQSMSNRIVFSRRNTKVLLPELGPKVSLSVFRVIQAAASFRRRSNKIPSTEKRQEKFENTYKLGPDPKFIFKSEKVQRIIQDILTVGLRDYTYSPRDTRIKCLNIASTIQWSVKRMGFSRHKIVCNVILMHNKGQSLQISSRCLWDTEFDSFATFNFKTKQIICVAIVHAVYFE